MIVSGAQMPNFFKLMEHNNKRDRIMVGMATSVCCSFNSGFSEKLSQSVNIVHLLRFGCIKW